MAEGFSDKRVAHHTVDEWERSVPFLKTGIFTVPLFSANMNSSFARYVNDSVDYKQLNRWRSVQYSGLTKHA